jgi:CP family cyanate transporter-like MFS transporter
MPSALALVLMTVPLGLGIGILTVTLPSVVKRSFAEIGGGATGTYLTASGLGAAAAGFLAVPLARAFGWRASLAIGAIPALLALPYWLRATGGPGAPASRERPSSGNSWPSDERLTLVVLTTAFVCQSAGFSGTISWLAALYEHAGWSADRAGVATGVAVALSVPAAALIPRRSDGGDRRRWVAVMAGMSACGILGFALDPRGLPWAWLSLFGVGNGALFPLILALVLDHAADEHEAAVLTRWTWGAGSLLAGFTPLLIGAMRDTAISFSTAFTILAACAAASGVLAMTLGRRTSNP